MNQIEVEASDAEHYKIKLRSGEVKVEMVNFIFWIIKQFSKKKMF